MNWKLRLTPNGGIPLYQQIENAIRAAVEAGQLKNGERIPSVVDLAKKLGINKLTVVKAFQKLEKTGLVRSEVGRGTFVSIAAAEQPAPTDGDPAPELARSIRRLREGYSRGLRELLMVERHAGDHQSFRRRAQSRHRCRRTAGAAMRRGPRAQSAPALRICRPGRTA